MTVPFFLGHFWARSWRLIRVVSDGFFIHNGGALPTLGAFDELCAFFSRSGPPSQRSSWSHGVRSSRLHRRARVCGASTTALMAVPYRRIIVMHLTIIFGGWIVLALGRRHPHCSFSW